MRRARLVARPMIVFCMMNVSSLLPLGLLAIRRLCRLSFRFVDSAAFTDGGCDALDLGSS